MNAEQAQMAPLFAAVANTLLAHRDELNQADSVNGNHGDHMVTVFELASQSASSMLEAPLAEVMDFTASRLAGLQDNRSAQVYAHGLQQFAFQFRQRQITLDELMGYVQSLVQSPGRPQEDSAVKNPRSGEILKALTQGLASWQQVEINPEQAPTGKLDVGYLFELGIAYMQARQRGGSQAEILAEAAASASPLRQAPYRLQSGRLAIQALIEAIANSTGSFGL